MKNKIKIYKSEDKCKQATCLTHWLTEKIKKSRKKDASLKLKISKSFDEDIEFIIEDKNNCEKKI